jgi:CheY-like chemotaxis protein
MKAKARILLIDDNLTNLDMFQRFLEDEDFHVTAIDHAPGALELLKKSHLTLFCLTT